MDLPVLYFNQLAWVPKGAMVSFIPVANTGSNLTYSSLGKAFKVRNSFVCVTSTRAQIEAAYNKLAPGSNLTKKSNPGDCTDGLNIAGLAVGVWCLWEGCMRGGMGGSNIGQVSQPGAWGWGDEGEDSPRMTAGAAM